jgi:F-type H+-transporting ATPase subunit gamma
MKRKQFFQHRLQTLSALRDAVGAMRSLSAHHFRRARGTLSATRAYREEMNQRISEIGIRQPLHPDAPVGMLVLASDLGLCGDYNARLAQLAIQNAQEHEAKVIYSVGRRVRNGLAKHSLHPARSYDAPASLEGLSTLLEGLAQDILDDYLARRIGALYVISAGFAGVGHFKPLVVRVLPIEPTAPTTPIPTSPYLDSDHLMMVAVREFFYISLFGILLDGLAAEHGMRLMAAESALEWLDGVTVATSRRLAAARSEASTQELLDIVSGSRQNLRRKFR